MNQNIFISDLYCKNLILIKGKLKVEHITICACLILLIYIKIVLIIILERTEKFNWYLIQKQKSSLFLINTINKSIWILWDTSTTNCSSFNWPLINKSKRQTQENNKKRKLSFEGSTCGNKVINPFTFCFDTAVMMAGP